MTAPVLPGPPVHTFQDFIHRLGDIPLDRVCFVPLPGTAREEDALALYQGEKRLCELVDHTLVMKPMGQRESRLAFILAHLLENYLEQHPIGYIFGEAALTRLEPGLLRAPDVGFYACRHFPDGKLPPEPILGMVPDLAVEVISRCNTPAEMDRKLQEYFEAGVRLVWYFYPQTRTARVYTSSEQVTELTENDALDGGGVLPGFRLEIREWLRRAGIPEQGVE